MHKRDMSAATCGELRLQGDRKTWPALAVNPARPCHAFIAIMAENDFLEFGRMFANYPTLQKELSMLDKPATTSGTLIAQEMFSPRKLIIRRCPTLSTAARNASTTPTLR